MHLMTIFCEIQDVLLPTDGTTSMAGNFTFILLVRTRKIFLERSSYTPVSRLSGVGVGVGVCVVVSVNAHVALWDISPLNSAKKFPR